MVTAPESLSHLSEVQLRQMVSAMMQTVATRDAEIAFKQAIIDKLTHENALLKRLKFAAQSERYSAEQRSLLDETLDADLQAVRDEIERFTSVEAAPREKQQPKQPAAAGPTAPPGDPPRARIHHLRLWLNMPERSWVSGRAV